MAIYCPNCGKELPDNAEFCSECGTKIPRRQESSAQETEIRETERPKKKGSISDFLGKLIIAAALLCALFFGGLMLWTKLHYNPELDGNVFPEPEETVTPAPQQDTSSETDKQETSKPAEQDTSGTENTEYTDVPQGILSPAGDPSFSDFEFYDKFTASGVPQDAYMMGAREASGSWKYCMIFNYYEGQGERFDEIGLAEITLGDGTVKLTLTPQLVRFGTEVQPSSDSYDAFTGNWEDDYISAEGNQAEITLWPFYEVDGKQYVIGSIINSQGNVGHFILVRP